MNNSSAHLSGAATARWLGYRFRRVTTLIVTVTAGLAMFGPAGPTAFAMIVPPSGTTPDPAAPALQVVNSGVAVWQVAVIAAGAALLGAGAVLLARRWHLTRWTDPSRSA
jgi:hypothetical protein